MLPYCQHFKLMYFEVLYLVIFFQQCSVKSTESVVGVTERIVQTRDGLELKPELRILWSDSWVCTSDWSNVVFGDIWRNQSSLGKTLLCMNDRQVLCLSRIQVLNPICWEGILYRKCTIWTFRLNHLMPFYADFFYLLQPLTALVACRGKFWAIPNSNSFRLASYCPLDNIVRGQLWRRNYFLSAVSDDWKEPDLPPFCRIASLQL